MLYHGVGYHHLKKQQSAPCFYLTSDHSNSKNTILMLFLEPFLSFNTDTGSDWEQIIHLGDYTRGTGRVNGEQNKEEPGNEVCIIIKLPL